MKWVDQFQQYRPLLFNIAYCMLGSVMDAEDMVQEAFLRWQRVSGDEIESPRAYLSAVITRLSIDLLRSARVQRESYIGPWLPEPLLTARQPELLDTVALAESLSLAFLTMLESLSPTERAAFLLRQVFDYGYDEIAAILDKSPANCRQFVSRARQRLGEGRPRFTAVPEQQDQLMTEFVQACLSGDMDGLITMLAEDAVLMSDGGGKVAAARWPVVGADRVARFIQGIIRKAPPGVEIQLAQVNGRTALIVTIDRQPIGVLTADGAVGQIQAVHIVVNPDKLGGVVRKA